MTNSRSEVKRRLDDLDHGGDDDPDGDHEPTGRPSGVTAEWVSYDADSDGVAAEFEVVKGSAGE